MNAKVGETGAGATQTQEQIDVDKKTETVSKVKAIDVEPRGLFKMAGDKIVAFTKGTRDIAVEHPGASAMVSGVVILTSLNAIYTAFTMGSFWMFTTAGLEIFALILLFAGAVKCVMSLGEWAKNKRVTKETVAA